MGPSHNLFADSNQHGAEVISSKHSCQKKDQSLLLSRLVVCSVMLPGETISAV